MKAERRTLRAEELLLLDIRKSLEGQVTVLGVELRAAPVELEELTL